MLTIHKHEVKLKKTYQQILYLAVAFNDTYVFQGRRGKGQDVVVHCDQEGTILFQYVSDCELDSFAMLSAKQILFLETKINKICCLNLQTHTLKKFNHYFMSFESDQVVIDTFAQSYLACVVQTGKYNDNRLILTYYDFEQFRDSTKPHLAPHYRFESKDDQWTYEMKVVKADSHSMYLWCKKRNDQVITLDYFDLQKEEGMFYKRLIIPHGMGQLYCMHNFQCAIQNAWSLGRNQVLLQCLTNKSEQPLFAQQSINNNFIVDLESKTVRQAKFLFKEQDNDCLIDCYNLGQFSIFKTFGFWNGSPKYTDYYFVDNSTEKVLGLRNRWYCSYRIKHLIPGYKNNLIYENQYENSKVNQFKIRQHKIYNKKIVYLHLLLELNEDFDDDLLFDACSLLEGEQ